ncbi:MAG: citrate transporter [Lachnospiraceae bacterium]|nr:citrate transporter [Lachnospiraceae bacterium]MDE6989815.1 citrate transporter [Lachnospiraceae bacterium]MDE6998841.1 citrate transporter [Lachnospiraceae bacterium]
MLAQVFAVIIFIAMFVFIVTEIVERHVVSLVCALLTVIFVFGVGMHSMAAVIETVNLQSIFTADFWYLSGESAESSAGINWETILFIFGMMVMVEGMARAGFFRWLCMRIARLVKYQVIPLFVTFMVLSTVLAMFIDSITVILFLAAVTIELSQLLKFNPVPMILSEIFCANLGGSATMCGDPPNIIIGTSLGYSFTDFVTNTGLIAGISLIAVLVYFYLLFGRELKTGAQEAVDYGSLPSPESTITDRKGFVVSSIIFAAAIVLLVTHAQTGLTVSAIGTIVAVATLVTSWRHAVTLLRKVDYRTLLFFIGLFVVIGGLEQTGILEIMAAFIGRISGGNVMVMIAIIIWLSAVASAFVDNIPFATTMIPIIRTLSVTYGVDLSMLAWTLAMGTDIGGSATPIGASANVVGIATAAREGYVIRWGQYCKKMMPATVIVVLISMLIIYVRYL